MSESRKHDPIQGEIIHEYDGIEEADNKLPGWWLWTFYIAIAFSFGYWLWVEAFEVSPGPLDSYIAERMEALDTGEEVTDEALVSLAADKLAVRAGERAFAQNCAKCHGSRGEGNIGPNLTDEFWLAGGAPVDIYATVMHGRNGKGMPAWGLQLGPGMCKQVTSYLHTLRGTNLPGKPPQGERWEAPAAAPAGPAAAPADGEAVKSSGLEAPADPSVRTAAR